MNFNRLSSHGHHGSKRRELTQHATLTWIARTHSLTHLHHDSYNHVVQSASSAITKSGIDFLFWRYLREGEQTGDKSFTQRNTHWVFIIRKKEVFPRLSKTFDAINDTKNKKQKVAHLELIEGMLGKGVINYPINKHTRFMLAHSAAGEATFLKSEKSLHSIIRQLQRIHISGEKSAFFRNAYSWNTFGIHQCQTEIAHSNKENCHSSNLNGNSLCGIETIRKLHVHRSQW